MFKLLKKIKWRLKNLKTQTNILWKTGIIFIYGGTIKQTQKIRKLYLKNFFNIKEDWFDEWSKFIFNQKKYKFL